MSNRSIFIGLIALIAVVLIAMLVVMIGIYRQNEALALTSGPTLTATINEATLAKANALVACGLTYYVNQEKERLCLETGGHFMGTSTFIP